jgi:hypothetical protein
VSSITPGGIDWKLSVLFTTTVTRTGSPARTCPVMSASNGVYPPSCETTSTSPTHTVARWVADSKCSTIRRPDQPRGTQTTAWYQASPK